MRAAGTPRTWALAAFAALIALALSSPGASAAVEVLSKSQSRVAEQGALSVRVTSERAAAVELKVRLRTSGGGKALRRFTVPRFVELPAGASRKLRLRLTPAGRARLERARAACLDAIAKVRADHRNPLEQSGRRFDRDVGRATLARDESLCPRGTAPGGGGGTGGSGGPGGGDPEPTSEISAGAASADITPPVGTPMFAYTARSNIADPPTDPQRGLQILADPDENLYAKSFEPSDGIHTRVLARAIVIESEDGEKFALAQVDLGGLPYAMVQEVVNRISSTGIESENLMISATHTHSSTGPIWPADSTGYGLLGGDIFDPRVFDITAEGIAEALIAADANLEPALVGVGGAELSGASRNRNFEPFQLNPDVPADEAAAREVSVNKRVSVIRVDALDGTPIGVWSNFAIHQTSFDDDNLLFSGDNAATTERVVEREIARDAADRGVAPPGDRPVVNVWTNGAEGDVSPDGGPPNPDGEPLYYVPTSAAGANMAGLKVADGVLAAWRDAEPRLTGEPELDARRTFLLFDGTAADGRPVGPTEALGAGGIVADDGTCNPLGDVDPAQGRKFPVLAGAGLVPQSAAVSLWRVDGFGIASFPNEITTQMGRRIAAAVGADSGGQLDPVIAGLTNGYNSYTATPEEYDACHYEGSFTLFGRNQGPRYRDVAEALVTPLLTGDPHDPGVEPPPAALGTPTIPPIQTTPDAGAATVQPADPVRRYERTTFAWKGGDPGIDAPRGETFVSLQREQGGDWVTLATEEGPQDNTVWDDADATWTDTWQFSECDPLGTYRFRVTGRAVRAGGGPTEDYEVISDTFELQPTAPLAVIDTVVNGNDVRVRARYPDPGASLLALPRRVSTGTATITVRHPDTTTSEVIAQPDSDGLAFEATIPAGATVEAVRVEDGCGNSTA